MCIRDREAAVNLTMEPNYTIVIDGVDRTFYDVNGKVCDPAVYNGSIYLPVSYTHLEFQDLSSSKS